MLLSGALLSMACGTIFPRYQAATRPPPQGMVESGTLRAPPENLRRLEVVSAELPPSRRDGRTWDDDGDPDLYVVIYRDGQEIYRTPVMRDSLRPRWTNAGFTARLDAHARFRIELRDDDPPLDELVAETHFMGVPTGAIDGSNIQLSLEGPASLMIRSTAPAPLLGMGVEYEVHESYLRVLAVEGASPAAAAGLQVGDRIVAIDRQTVESLGEVGARQAMDRGSVREVQLTVEREGRPMFVVDVRLDAVYPAR
ncbi:MAG: PDZ domain-containing protein [Polyangiales bacterium]